MINTSLWCVPLQYLYYEYYTAISHFWFFSFFFAKESLIINVFGPKCDVKMTCCIIFILTVYMPYEKELSDLTKSQTSGVCVLAHMWLSYPERIRSYTVLDTLKRHSNWIEKYKCGASYGHAHSLPLALLLTHFHDKKMTVNELLMENSFWQSSDNVHQEYCIHATWHIY